MDPTTEFHPAAIGFTKFAMVFFHNANGSLNKRRVYSYWLPDDADVKPGDYLEVRVPECSRQESKRVYVDKVFQWDVLMSGCNYKRAVGMWPTIQNRFPFQTTEGRPMETSFRVNHAINRIRLAVDKKAQYNIERRGLTLKELNDLNKWYNDNYSPYDNTQQAVYRGNCLHKEIELLVTNGMDDNLDAFPFIDKYFNIKPKENSTMNTDTIKIETIILITAPGINQQNADHLTDDQLIDAISKANHQLHLFQSLVKDGNTSKKLAAKIEKLELDIVALTDLVDARPAK